MKLEPAKHFGEGVERRWDGELEGFLGTEHDGGWGAWQKVHDAMSKGLTAEKSKVVSES